MDREILTQEDIRQAEKLGMDTEKVLQQIDLFRRPPSYLQLLRPSTVGDGITVVHKDSVEELISLFHRESCKGRSLKFIPASGAASRMFKALLRFLEEGAEITRNDIESLVKKGDKDAEQLLTFMDHIREFAFFDELSASLSKGGLRMESLLREGRFDQILRRLLFEPGLGYNDLPKGLLRFHRYASEERTAFEEHLVEAVSYAADEHGRCRLHFTVSPSHLDRFRSLLAQVRPLYEKRLHASFHVTFSVQKRSTDTVAVDLENRPFRLEDGRLLFRPGGHGALIENLNDLRGDILFIKNIDNVVPDRLKGETARWKKILGGYLLHLQGRTFDCLEKLSRPEPGEQLLKEVSRFLQEELSMDLPPSFSSSPPYEQRVFLTGKLNRPIRVCGMVRNVGEPGGGPFWVRDKEGGSSLQIVESAQVDPSSPEQQDLLSRSTHFNPVDIVCGVRDRRGNPFDLPSHVDPDTYIVTKKSKNGQELKALELPGLWNGGMADWITVFVEVPLETFNPVKTVNDLLRESHQAER